MFSFANKERNICEVIRIMSGYAHQEMQKLQKSGPSTARYCIKHGESGITPCQHPWPNFDPGMRSRGGRWGCSDSDSGSNSGLLIDSDSGSDSGSDTKYKINNTLIVEQVSAVQAKKRNVTFPIDFGFHSLGRKIFIPGISHTSRITFAATPKNCGCHIIYYLRSCSCGTGASSRRRPA